ncbi:n-acetylglutamate synthase [Dyadobacter psychrotolerans]|uniref:N-acetylglutamate synthase n=1 Tax=Dyadobacter psychrotolerans TaxID=2541721 RepID=A0A4R5DX99_9BACT|nr:n-acetylglutamate synthase [Dyadobacter psychrotolerans]TDE16801.1 n-acetylglutamate synthase [Dyadobacter psychrotolerans]
MIDYNNKIFIPLSNSENGEVDLSMQFHYKQNGNILTCSYSGGRIRLGQLIALVDENGCLDMRYHQINTFGEIMTGICKSTPEILESGKIRLFEKWKWTAGDFSEGESVLVEQ